MDLNYKTVNEAGVEISTEVLGFFTVEELGKEFVMYSIVDNNPENDMGAVLLGEVIREDDTIQILDIKKDEVDLVVAFYNEISNQVGGE